MNEIEAAQYIVDHDGHCGPILCEVCPCYREKHDADSCATVVGGIRGGDNYALYVQWCIDFLARKAQAFQASGYNKVRLSVGSRVRTTKDGHECTGVLVKDARDHQPYLVRLDTKKSWCNPDGCYWFHENEVILLDAKTSSASRRRIRTDLLSRLRSKA